MTAINNNKEPNKKGVKKLEMNLFDNFLFDFLFFLI